MDLQILKDHKCSSTAIKATCNAMKVDPTDAVFFWYNGHGFISPKEQASNWPALYLEYQGDKTNLELASIYQMRIAKKPRLLLVSADLCSSFSTDGHVPKLVPVGRGKEDRSAQQYTQLFVVSQGAYIASGSQKGLPTWTGPNGSYYTMAMRAEVYNTAHGAGTDKRI